MQLSLKTLFDLNWRAAEIHQAIWTEFKLWKTCFEEDLFTQMLKGMKTEHLIN